MQRLCLKIIPTSQQLTDHTTPFLRQCEHCWQKKKRTLKKHSAVIGYFRKNYIKTGIFETRFSDYIGDAFEVRNDCDYEDFYIASREEAEIQYLHAIEFYEAAKNYLENLK